MVAIHLGIRSPQTQSHKLALHSRQSQMRPCHSLLVTQPSFNPLGYPILPSLQGGFYAFKRSGAIWRARNWYLPILESQALVVVSLPSSPRQCRASQYWLCKGISVRSSLSTSPFVALGTSRHSAPAALQSLLLMHCSISRDLCPMHCGQPQVGSKTAKWWMMRAKCEIRQPRSRA